LSAARLESGWSTPDRSRHKRRSREWRLIGPGVVKGNEELF
jgi:hypothetical protein